MPPRRPGATAGKLRAIARAWAEGRGAAAERGDDVATQASALPDWLTGTSRADGEIAISPNDSPLVALFYALDTQWLLHPMAGVRTGINYAAIAPTASLMGIDMTPSMMVDLRAMELAALSALSRKAGR